MHRFFVGPSQVEDNYIDILGQDVHHIGRVLRLSPNDELIICDGQGTDYYCIITNVNTDVVRTQILSSKASDTELPTHITLFQGIPKGDKMELIIQKCVELGVYEIVPVAMKRCVSKLDSKSDKKINRWQDIALSAAKQSNRSIIPEILSPMGFKESIKYAEQLDCIITAYEDADGFKNAKEVFKSLNQYKKIGLFVGPEGGFDKEEISMLELYQSKIITLGRRILRTETAGLTAMAIMMFHLEEE